MFGAAAHDIIKGEGGADYGVGGVGNDYVYGGPDADLLLYGQSGRDYVSGEGGADRCLAVIDGDGEDTVKGGQGYDTFAADAGDTMSSVERRRNGCANG